MSISRWIDKQIEVYPLNEKSFSNKLQWTTDTCNNIDKSHKDHTEWKKPNKTMYTLCIPFTWTSEIDKTDMVIRWQKSDHG